MSVEAADPILDAVARVGEMVRDLKVEIEKLADEIKRQNDLTEAWLVVADKSMAGVGRLLSSSLFRTFAFLAGAGALLRLFGFTPSEALTLLQAVPP